MRELQTSSDPRAAAAIAFFVYAMTKAAGAYASVLGGLDALVFTAGIGENSAPFVRGCAMRAKLTKLGCAQAMPIREEDRRGIPRRVATPLACSLDQPLNLCLICLLRLVACSASAAFLTEGRHGHPVPPKIVEPERAITPSRNMWKLIEPNLSDRQRRLQ